jgi:hypothetical protein
MDYLLLSLHYDSFYPLESRIRNTCRNGTMDPVDQKRGIDAINQQDSAKTSSQAVP